MVTVVPLMMQAPVAVMVGTVLSFVVATTVNVSWYEALAGAPVKLTVGTIALVTVVVPVTLGAVK
jgi:hypothetical protein